MEERGRDENINRNQSRRSRSKGQRSRSTGSSRCRCCMTDQDSPWLQKWTNETIRAEQVKDEAIRKILEWKESRDKRPVWEEVSPENKEVKAHWAQWHRLEVKNSLLCRRWENNEGDKVTWQLVVPRSLQGEVITLLHDHPTSGHLGVKRTICRVQERFYWHTWRRCVERRCKACEVCCSRKMPKRKPRAKLQSYRVGAPLERIALDILGPLPITDRGNKYVMIVADCFTKWVEAYP
ncbi:Retrovirus-related Pol polyprotein from transposon [Apostichopus japonicus]|uniref:Retrovirus-related Pol polyprotein from transposon n=1 Tax=Stichopus japonicus TaxID=307972 RepID=A0A2G8K5E0_STIJA|nr:Retrovirus-related Pol polyprotein from transposon [Apostichopus japonicus]